MTPKTMCVRLMSYTLCHIQKPMVYFSSFTDGSDSTTDGGTMT